MDAKAGDAWEQATWSGARLAGLQAGAGLTLTEKLAWLDQAHRLVVHLERRRELATAKALPTSEKSARPRG